MMGVRSLIALMSVVSLFSFVGCSKEPTKFEPSTRGKRGENCQARNDCQDGLACLNGICGINEFSISVATKHCDKIECATTADCCGDKPTEKPAKCNAQAKTCTQNFPGCSAAQVCTSDAACQGGTCRAAAATGTCTGGLVSLSCATAADCQDRCVTSSCTISGGTCTADSDCFYYSATAPTCTKPNRTCNCINPDYNPSAAICNDLDCTDLCTLRCDDERCVADRSCKADADCGAATPICSDGQCVQCTTDDDCGDDKSCDLGVCHARCKHNEECSAFYECNADSGECEYVGCKSDRECILNATGSGQTAESIPTSTGEDPRLLKCLPSEADKDHKTCKIPCENDGSCGPQSVCDAGFCKFIGCDTDEECRAYLKLVSQVTTTAKPYVTTAVCRE